MGRLKSFGIFALASAGCAILFTAIVYYSGSGRVAFDGALRAGLATGLMCGAFIWAMAAPGGRKNPFLLWFTAAAATMMVFLLFSLPGPKSWADIGTLATMCGVTGLFVGGGVWAFRSQKQEQVRAADHNARRKTLAERAFKAIERIDEALKLDEREVVLFLAAPRFVLKGYAAEGWAAPTTRSYRSGILDLYEVNLTRALGGDGRHVRGVWTVVLNAAKALNRSVSDGVVLLDEAEAMIVQAERFADDFEAQKAEPEWEGGATVKAA